MHKTLQGLAIELLFLYYSCKFQVLMLFLSGISYELLNEQDQICELNMHKSGHTYTDIYTFHIKFLCIIIIAIVYSYTST